MNALKRFAIKWNLHKSPWTEWRTSDPSTTILLFNVPSLIKSNHLLNLLCEYGEIKAVETSVEGNVALADFANLTGAYKLMKSAQTKPFYFQSNNILMEYSSQKLLSAPEIASHGKVLRVDISNVLHTVNESILNSITSSIATPVKIVIGPLQGNNTLVAMMECSTNLDAQKIRNELHGAHIYRNSCSMEIKLSPIPFLPSACHKRKSWLFEMRPSLDPPIVKKEPPNEFRPIKASTTRSNHTFPLTTSDRLVNGSSLVAFQNLPPNINCDHLMNLCSVYGNVMRITFPRLYKNKALVEMASPHNIKTIAAFLNKLPLFQRQIDVSVSEEHELMREIIYRLPDGSPSSKTYLRGSLPFFQKNNYLDKPSKRIFFCGLPLDLNEKTLRQVLHDAGAPMPKFVAILPSKPLSTTSLGILTYENLDDAVLTIVMANNMLVKHKGKHGRRLILEFSRPRVNLQSEKS